MEANILNLIYNNKLEELKQIATSYNFNTHIDHGDTPLMAAIRDKNVEVTRVLLENGADPDFADKAGGLPLHFAVQKKNMEIVKLLVAHGANIDKQDSKFGNTALSVAISKTEGREFIDYFLSLGTDATIPNKAGVTPAAAAKIYNISLTQNKQNER